MRKWGVVALCAALSGCAFQRAEVAQTAQASMVGMTKEQILALHLAASKPASEGKTEVWGYSSGTTRTPTLEGRSNAETPPSVSIAGPLPVGSCASENGVCPKCMRQLTGT
jgi:hypothetical protein